jgi:hypothetical protein
MHLYSQLSHCIAVDKKAFNNNSQTKIVYFEFELKKKVYVLL